MKGISADSTPSFTRSSSAIGGWSNEWISLSVDHTDDSLERASPYEIWVPSDISIHYLQRPTNPRVNAGESQTPEVQ
jgi:hypothetical protein